jgi:hypothetical protein
MFGALGIGALALGIALPLANLTNIFRPLGDQGAGFAVVLFLLTGAVVGAIAGATDAIVVATRQRQP